MSVEALRWALEQAPIPPLPSGKPNSAAAGVLTSLAWHADRHGANSYPSVERIQLESRYGTTAVRTALTALERAGLIARDGHGPSGTTKWRLDITTAREQPITAELELATAVRREADRQRQQKKRHDVTPPNGVTQPPILASVTPLNGVTPADVTPLNGVMSRRLTADVTPPSGPEQSLNLPRTNARGHAAPGPPATRGASGTTDRPPNETFAVG
jgi:hypothetical protein